jgi:hypothetical protein
LFSISPATEQLEDALQPGDLPFRLAQVRLEAGTERGCGGLADHLRQRLRDLVLGVVHVLKLVEEQVVEGDDVLAEEAHGICPVSRESTDWSIAVR